MADIKKGSICRSLAGHDKGTYYIIVETGNVIKVSDGKYRPLSNPKVKNLKRQWIIITRLSLFTKTIRSNSESIMTEWPIVS